jgi:hypothetical protein
MTTNLCCKKCKSIDILRINRTKVERVLFKVISSKNEEKRKYKCLSCHWVGFISIKI